MSEAINITDGNLEKTLGTAIGLIDFWAPWCGPCKMQGPVIESLAATFKGKAVIAKVNVDENGELAGKYNVSSIPTLLLFKNGEIVKQFVGFQSEDALTAELNSLI